MICDGLVTSGRRVTPALWPPADMRLGETTGDALKTRRREGEACGLASSTVGSTLRLGLSDGGGDGVSVSECALARGPTESAW